MEGRSATLQRSQSPVAVARPDQPDYSAWVEVLLPGVPDFEEALMVADATEHLMSPASWSVMVGALLPWWLARSRNHRRGQQMTARAPTMPEFHSSVAHMSD